MLGRTSHERRREVERESGSRWVSHLVIASQTCKQTLLLLRRSRLWETWVFVCCRWVGKDCKYPTEWHRRSGGKGRRGFDEGSIRSP